MSPLASVLTAALALAALAAPASPPTALIWEPWSPEVFARAQREKKPVLLAVEAVWCHWCHVMARTTYVDPKVVALLRQRFLLVRADADADVALANRYEEWGWPATVVFAPDGTELVKRRGYLPPERMASMLQAILDDPTPGPSVGPPVEVGTVEHGALPPKTRDALTAAFDGLYDETHAGWGQGHQMIDADALGLALARAEAGDVAQGERAHRTLDAALALVDPVWGGVYQYSDARDWKSPHFEKLLSIQVAAIRLYALASVRWSDPRYLRAAQSTARYLTTFLSSPDGAFLPSQDADLSEQVDGHAYFALGDAERRRLGVPRVDPHRYARETGWAISALCALHDVSPEPALLDRALRAAEWALAQRGLPDGTFRHGGAEEGGPGTLGDSIAMGQAFLALYGTTADPAWLARAERIAAGIDARFRDPAAPGYGTPPPRGAVGVFRRPLKHLGENAELARFANLLSQLTGEPTHRAIAERAMRYLVGHVAADPARRYYPEVLRADRELATAPLHLTVLGRRGDLTARALHAAARRYPVSYKRTEWWDRDSGLPSPRNLEVAFPTLSRPAVFACAKDSCSLPVYDPAKLPEALDRLRGRSFSPVAR